MGLRTIYKNQNIIQHYVCGDVYGSVREGGGAMERVRPYTKNTKLLFSTFFILSPKWDHNYKKGKMALASRLVFGLSK